MTKFDTAGVRSAEPILRAEGLTKHYGPVVALDSVQFDLRPGEVHILFGENGAGKSTLIHVISGAIGYDAGLLKVAGKAVRFRNVHDARAKGIAAMFQEFSLAPHLTVEENVLLGMEPKNGIWIRRAALREAAKDAIAEFGFDLDVRAPVSSLTRAQAQMVELTKALLVKPRILILDEPTASLSKQETMKMFKLVRRLRKQGVAIIYITHRINEIEEIGDRVTVMRDGKYIDTVDVAQSDHQTLVELMTGRAFESFYPDIPHDPRETLLEISDLHTQSGGVKGAFLTLRAGEIVGLAGLVGCGKSRIARAVFGLEKITSGRIRVFGKQISSPTPRKMMGLGVGYITSDRHKEGLMLIRSTKENLTLSVLGQKDLAFWGGLNAAAKVPLRKNWVRRCG